MAASMIGISKGSATVSGTQWTVGSETYIILIILMEVLDKRFVFCWCKVVVELKLAIRPHPFYS
jgi:hypothetical protein